MVDVEDVNDVPPRFSRPEWTLDVSENQHPDDVLATLTVVDQDVTNNFTFRVSTLLTSPSLYLLRSLLTPHAAPRTTCYISMAFSQPSTKYHMHTSATVVSFLMIIR